MFIDEAKIFVKAGSGGKGCDSLYRERGKPYGKPNGGDGGNGGSIILVADNNVHTLLGFKFNKHFVAASGGHGGSNFKNGYAENDRIVRVPPGTIIRDARHNFIIRDLQKVGDKITVAKGGAGGKGNSKFQHALDGEPGEEKELLLELKLVADVGIIGYPNSGKSTLISKISRAKSKIANYPFTTKSPILGVAEYDDETFVVADIPGLIEGAHLGRGLGHQFLKHVERTKLLVHLVDMAAIDGRVPYEDYKSINKELKLYKDILGRREQIVVANKMDMPSAKANLNNFKKKVKKKIFEISALNGKGLKELQRAILSKLKSEAKKTLAV